MKKLGSKDLHEWIENNFFSMEMRRRAHPEIPEGQRLYAAEEIIAAHYASYLESEKNGNKEEMDECKRIIDEMEAEYVVSEQELEEIE